VGNLTLVNNHAPANVEMFLAFLGQCSLSYCTLTIITVKPGCMKVWNKTCDGNPVKCKPDKNAK